MASSIRQFSRRIIGGCALFALPACAAWADGALSSQQAFVAPTVQQMEWLAAPPSVSAEQKAQLEAAIARTHLEVPTPSSGAAVSPPLSGSATEVSTVSPQTTTAPLVYLTRDLFGVAPTGYTSTVNEPAAANVGKYVFYTANWFAARSNNQGVSWTYVNPYSGFSDFCCDQDVIYDKGRDLIVWLRMGVADGNGENRFMLSASTDGGNSFCTYVVGTQNGTTHEWYDYPHLATTNNSLYISWNMFTQAGSYVRSRTMRWPLEQMANCAALSYSWFDDAGGTMTPAQGGSSKIYVGQHRNTSTLRIYSWQEGTGTISFADRTVPAWTSTPRGSAVCTTADGNNPCARLDSRITTGYVKRHSALAFSQLETVGFFWTVAQGGGFAMPYANNAWFYTNTMNYGGRDYIWNSSNAFMYVAAYPDVRGNVGIVMDYAGPTAYPTVLAGKDDYTDGLPPGWGVSVVMAGNDAPDADNWGDYNRVRPFAPVGTCWLGTGHVLMNGGANTNVHPLYFIFGNPRDYNSCYLRWRQLG